MRSIYVPIPERAVEQLRQVARNECRSPKDQATWLILEGLQRRGGDVGTSTAERSELATASAKP